MTNSRGFFYGENRFAITRRAPRGLRALERFRKSTLANIKLLIFRINIASCNDVCCGSRNRRCGNHYVYCNSSGSHGTVLSHASSSDQLIISQWRRICARLAESARPRQLALYIVCDYENRQTANMIIEPLLMLPVLRDLGLRLARDHVKELQGMARETVWRLTDYSAPPSLPPFEFLRLPKEIQLNILEYTSLLNRRTITCRQNQMLCEGTCSVRGMAADVTVPDNNLLRCFCSRGHSAFSFRCDRCESLGFPHALFLVSRAFRAAAAEVFYGRNTFAVSIVDFMPSPLTPGHNGCTWVTTSGLERFPRCHIRFITTLRLEFECSRLDIPQPDRAEWKCWLNTVDLLSKEANLAILNLEIRLAENFYPSIWELPGMIDVGYDRRRRDTYHQLIRPVTALRGLKNFFVHLNWGSSYSVPGQGVPDRRCEVEQNLERMVMGEEYDAWKCGKDVAYDLSFCA